MPDYNTLILERFNPGEYNPCGKFALLAGILAEGGSFLALPFQTFLFYHIDV
jgi:hypothetical protein